MSSNSLNVSTSNSGAEPCQGEKREVGIASVGNAVLQRAGRRRGSSMGIRIFIKRIPFATRVHRRVAPVARGHAVAKAMRRLESRGRQAARGIRRVLTALRGAPSPSARRWRDRIESERRRLLADDAPLDDGTLGEAGLFDAGQSVGDACRVSVSEATARLLFDLAREWKPSRVLELGANAASRPPGSRRD